MTVYPLSRAHETGTDRLGWVGAIVLASGLAGTPSKSAIAGDSYSGGGGENKIAMVQTTHSIPTLADFVINRRAQVTNNDDLRIGVTDAKDALALEFAELADGWKHRTMYVSSAHDEAMDPAYQRIIGMGERALPYIFADLEKGGSGWWWALTSITGADPIPPEDAGRVSLMRDHWLNWGRERYRWGNQS